MERQAVPHMKDIVHDGDELRADGVALGPGAGCWVLTASSANKLPRWCT